MKKINVLYRGKSTNDDKWIEGLLYNIQPYPTSSFRPAIQVLKLSTLSWTTVNINVWPETIGQWSGLIDDDGVKIFEDDLRTDTKGNIFRVYLVPGGFVMKASIWSNNINDIQWDDELIHMPLADAQTSSYICHSTKHYGNIHDLNKI